MPTVGQPLFVYERLRQGWAAEGRLVKLSWAFRRAEYEKNKNRGMTMLGGMNRGR